MAVTANQDQVSFYPLISVTIDYSYLVEEAEEIYANTAVQLNDEGRLVNYIADSNFLFIGFAKERKTGDISEGVACVVKRVGVFKRMVVATSIPVVGDLVYATDNFTFTTARPALPADTALTSTVTISAADPAVITGVGTNFSGEMRPGDLVYDAADTAPNARKVDFVTSDTSATLIEAYPGTTGVALSTLNKRASKDDAIGRVAGVHSNTSIDCEFFTLGMRKMTIDGDITSISTTNLTLSGVLTVNDVTDSISKDTGAIICEGGVGIEKSVFIGGTCNVTSVDSEAAETLTIGPATATRVEIADTGIVTDVEGPLHASEFVLSDELDTLTATTLLIGKSTATRVEIGDTGVVVETEGPLHATEFVLTDEIDALTAASLLIGKATATKLELADTGIETEIQGTLDAQEAATFSGVMNSGSDAGIAADVYALTLAPALSGYVDGQVFFMKDFNADNTGACTLNVNAKGAIAIKIVGGGDPAGADIQTDGAYTFIYDSTGPSFILMNPS